jgi:hypothetical protein
MEHNMDYTCRILTGNDFGSQVFISFLGAFFGFLFAIILESLFSKLLARGKRKNTIESLTTELNELFIELNPENPHDTYFRYDYSVWRTAENSGELLSISQTKEYKQLFSIYSDIYFADLLEQQYFDLYKLKLLNDTKDLELTLNKIDKKRKEKHQKICDKIASFVTEKCQK